MPWWFWVGLGVGLGAWFWRITFRAFWEAELRTKYTTPGGDDLALDMMMATVTFLFIGPGKLLLGLLARLRGRKTNDWYWIARALGGESRETKQKRKEEELREREEWIARKERELGIQ